MALLRYQVVGQSLRHSLKTLRLATVASVLKNLYRSLDYRESQHNLYLHASFLHPALYSTHAWTGKSRGDFVCSNPRISDKPLTVF